MRTLGTCVDYGGLLEQVELTDVAAAASQRIEALA